MMPLNICIKLCRVRGFLQAMTLWTVSKEEAAATTMTRTAAAPALPYWPVAKPAARGAGLTGAGMARP